VKASDWKSSASCCEIPSCIVFEEVVMRVETLPGEIYGLSRMMSLQVGESC
jgi:hypothetical protein